VIHSSRQARACWAALILLTSYDFFGHSQQVLPDMRWSPSSPSRAGPSGARSLSR
jgi:hypothetical protein